nr:ulp1 protease family, C-terminal catalytic domain-containing protein [Ipomoea batatas]
MVSANDSSPELQRVVNRQGEVGPSNALDSLVLAASRVRKTCKKRKNYTALRSRASSSQFLDALQGLNAAQAAIVLEMGFGSLLHLHIVELLTRMGYWLVENYNPRNSTLYIADGTRLCITEEDVQLILGFPKGDLKIAKWSRAYNTNLLEEWKWLVDRYKLSTTITAQSNAEPCHSFASSSVGVRFNRGYPAKYRSSASPLALPLEVPSTVQGRWRLLCLVVLCRLALHLLRLPRRLHIRLFLLEVPRRLALLLLCMFQNKRGRQFRRLKQQVVWMQCHILFNGVHCRLNTISWPRRCCCARPEVYPTTPFESQVFW